jgi:hypothetical protein
MVGGWLVTDCIQEKRQWTEPKPEQSVKSARARREGLTCSGDWGAPSTDYTSCG